METLNIILILLFAVCLSLVLRGFYLWYWQIDERTKQATKTNVLLEMMLVQMGANTRKIEVEDSKKSESKMLDVDEWVKLKTEGSKRYKLIKYRP